MKYQKEYKRYCIEQHRKMWIWVACQYNNGSTDCIENLKREYFQKFRPDIKIECDCFCCEYDIQAGIGCCAHCPLMWSNDSGLCCACISGEFGDLMILTNESQPDISQSSEIMYQRCEIDTKLCSELAERIANLPERMGI